MLFGRNKRIILRYYYSPEEEQDFEPISVKHAVITKSDRDGISFTTLLLYAIHIHIGDGEMHVIYKIRGYRITKDVNTLSRHMLSIRI